MKGQRKSKLNTRAFTNILGGVAKNEVIRFD